MDNILYIIGTLTLTVAGNWLWSRLQKTDTEFQLDGISISLIDRALDLLPMEERERYREEWFAYILESESPQNRLLQSIGFLLAATKISAEARLLIPVSTSIRAGAVSFSRGIVISYNFLKTSRFFQFFKNPLFFLINQRKYIFSESFTIPLALLLGVFWFSGHNNDWRNELFEFIKHLLNL